MAQRKKSQPPAPSTDTKNANGDVDVATFSRAYLRLETTARSLDRAALRPVNVDVQLAALIALGVIRRLRGSSRQEELQALGKTGLYDAGCLEMTEEAAMATWYARHQAIHATEDSNGTSTKQLASEGFALRAKMLKVIEYNLEDDPRVMSQVEAIRQGGGYLDLANDLVAVAGLYRSKSKVLSVDRRHHDAKDANIADRLASALLERLGGKTKPVVDWADMQSRCWTLLQRSYEQVRRGCVFLTWGTEEEHLFPSLVTAARALPTPTPAPPPKPTP
jgi:hypothetical protein